MIAASTSVAVVDAVVEFHGLVPVVAPRTVVEAVVAGTLCRIFDIRFLTLLGLHRRDERLTGTVVEVVGGREVLARVVVLTEVAHAVRLHDRVVLACHVVGHEVDDDLHAGLVCAVDEQLELVHAPVDVVGQIRIDVVVVCDSIGRSCHALHHGRMLSRYAMLAVVGSGGVADDARIPHMGEAHVVDAAQPFRVEVTHLSRPVDAQRAVGNAGRVTVAKETGKDLVNDDFSLHPIICVSH